MLPGIITGASAFRGNPRHLQHVSHALRSHSHSGQKVPWRVSYGFVSPVQEQWCKKAPPTHEMIVRYEMQPPFPSDPPTVAPANQKQVNLTLLPSSISGVQKA